MNRCQMARELVANLREHPEEWSFDDYKATHVSGLRIWLANSYYGLGVMESDSLETILGGTRDTPVFLFGRLVPWRSILGRAFFRAYKARNEVSPDSIIRMFRGKRNEQSA